MNESLLNNLSNHANYFKDKSLAEITSARKDIRNFIIETESLYADFNRNFINSETLDQMHELLDQRNFSQKREKLFSGEILNYSEKRSADHIALRNSGNDLYRGKNNLKNEITQSLQKIENFTEIVHSGKKQANLIANIGFIVHIGIGGSDLGPRMIVDSLEEFKAAKSPEVFFISSVDPYEINRILKKIDLSRTIFINVSKSLTTPETMHITNAFIEELKKNGLNPTDHLLAVTANPDAPKMLPVHLDNCFFFPESIGGRYSLWSSVGLVISLFLGFKGFLELLNGASRMDRHFFSEAPEKNLPVILAFLEFWYFNYFDSHFHTINFYTDTTAAFPVVSAAACNGV